MKRQYFLDKMGIKVVEEAKMRVMIDTDCANEADDHFAIMQQLLSPSLDVLGIIATHFEKKSPTKDTMEKSFKEINTLLNVAKIDDIKVYKGSVLPLSNGLEESEGAKAIITEAKKGKLYISCQGALTNVATALLLDPSIASNLVVLWNGGEPYGNPRFEFNLQQDIKAGQIVCDSACDIWQTPQNVYSSLEVSLAELKLKVYPCGDVGKYMYENLVNMYKDEFNPFFRLRTGENWTLGDNTVIAMLLSTKLRGQSKVIKCPKINDEGHYIDNPNGKDITVYSSIDVRFVLDDLYAKLQLAYK